MTLVKQLLTLSPAQNKNVDWNWNSANIKQVSVFCIPVRNVLACTTFVCGKENPSEDT
jgi:hypothetical protein